MASVTTRKGYSGDPQAVFYNPQEVFDSFQTPL